MGTVSTITPDIEELIGLVRARLPNVEWEQLSVTHTADDDGLWFFWIPSRPGEVQIESSSGACPFLVETDKHGGRVTTTSLVETADVIVEWLELSGGRARASREAT